MEKKIAKLEQILSKQLEEHELMFGLLKRKREALRQANHRLVRDCCEQENHRVQAIGELEKHRLRLVGELTLMLNPHAAAPMLLGELAERLDEPARGRLLVFRQQLREKMEQIRHDASVVRRATESLTRHMQGLVQTISGAMNCGGVYGSGGAPPQRAMAMSTFNTTA